MDKLNSGDLDRRISIEVLSESQNSMGEVTREWVPHAEVWAKVIAGRPIERFEDNRTIALNPILFFIRYLSGVGFTSRIIYHGHPYEVTGLTEIGRREYLKIEALRVE